MTEFFFPNAAETESTEKKSNSIDFDEFGPELIFEVYDPKTKMHGFTVIDNTALGVGKGGIRMTPNVTIDEVARLARTMTWKNSLAGLPFGGAKSGLIMAKEMEANKKSIIESFGKALKPICPKKYIAAPDINSGEKEMEWFADAVQNFNACTGKPADYCLAEGICGIPHELGSTGFGVYHSTLIGMKFLKMRKEKTTIAIEGFGNVGSFAAKFLSEQGIKIIAVSDSKGTILDSNGLNIEKLMQVKKSTGSVANYGNNNILQSSELLELEADILITAAGTDVIHNDNVDKIKAKMIVEGSNIPMKEETEKTLNEKGILVIPDFVANAGGVISSYAEYKHKTVEQMFSLVEKKIRSNTKKVLLTSKKQKIAPREAGMQIAKARVIEAMKKKGLQKKEDNRNLGSYCRVRRQVI